MSRRLSELKKMEGKRFTNSVKELDSTNPETKVAKLADMIGYQADAVVSRTIVDKEAGTVTLFAFDKGQRLSEHTAPFDALVYLLDGEAEASISGKTHRLKEGEIIIMPANKPHAINATNKFKMILTMIHS